jgi:hypothetical protein
MLPDTGIDDVKKQRNAEYAKHINDPVLFIIKDGRYTFTFLPSHLHLDGPGELSRYNGALRAGQSGDLIPVGARFSAPVPNDPGTHPASYTMVTESFLRVKRPERGVDHPPPSGAEVKERVALYLYPPLGLRGQV